MSKMREGQVSVEAVFAASILLLIFTMIGVSATENKAEIAETEQVLAARGECFRISNSIAQAYTAGNGTEILLKTGHISRIHAPDNLVYVFSEEDSDEILWICKCAISLISNKTSSSFSIIPGTVSISNINGTVIVENV